MASETNDLTFVRCPSCRSLVPASASRCRICNNPLDALNKSEPDAAKAAGRVRQKTMTASPQEVEDVLRSAMKSGAEPPAGKPSAPPPRAAAVREPIADEFDPLGAYLEEIESGGTALETEPAGAKPAPQAAAAPSADDDDDDLFDLDIFDEPVAEEPVAKAVAPAPVMAAEPEPAPLPEPVPQAPSAPPPAPKAPAAAPAPERAREARPQAQEQQQQQRRQEQQRPPQRAERMQEQRQGKPQQGFQQRGGQPQQQQPQQRRDDREQKRQDRPPRQEPPRREHEERRDAPHERAHVAGPKTGKMRPGRLFGWLVSYESADGRAIELREGKFFVTSSSIKGSDLILEDPSISTPHALMSISDGGLLVQDLMSDHGVFVRQGEQGSYRREDGVIRVSHGGWIKFGDVEFLVVIVPSSSGQG